MTCGDPTHFTVTMGQSLPANPSDGTCALITTNQAGSGNPDFAAEGRTAYPIYRWEGSDAVAVECDDIRLCFTKATSIGSAPTPAGNVQCRDV